MLVLIGIGLAAGFITAISPCVLPVLPIIFAGGATGGRRKPFAIIAGLVLSFSAFTLFGVWLLKRLGLPEDLLRDIAIGLLFLVAATLLFPKIEELVQRPLPPADAEAGRRPRRRLPARGEPRARVRAVRGPRARSDHRRRRHPGCRWPGNRPHARLRDRRRDPDAARRLRRALGDGRAPAARAPHPPGPRRRRRADGAGDRAERRPPLPDGDPGLHGGASGQDRAERPGTARAAEAPRRDAPSWRRAPRCGTSGRRPSWPASRTGSTAIR